VKQDVRYAVDGKWTKDLVKALDLFKERITRSTPDSPGRLFSQVREHYEKIAP
jgi:hypothetical protein